MIIACSSTSTQTTPASKREQGPPVRDHYTVAANPLHQRRLTRLLAPVRDRAAMRQRCRGCAATAPTAGSGGALDQSSGFVTWTPLAAAAPTSGRGHRRGADCHCTGHPARAGRRTRRCPGNALAANAPEPGEPTHCTQGRPPRRPTRKSPSTPSNYLRSGQGPGPDLVGATAPVGST